MSWLRHEDLEQERSAAYAIVPTTTPAALWTQITRAVHDLPIRDFDDLPIQYRQSYLVKTGI